LPHRAILSLALLVACSGDVREGDGVSQRSGIPPWHMWGNTQVFDVPKSSGGATRPLDPTPGQIVRVSYLRPETWHWIISAKLLSGPNTTAIGQHVSLSIHWDLIVGIGRSTIVIPDWDVFSFNWNDGDTFPQDEQIWSTQTQAPAKAFVKGPPAPSSGPVDQIIAQDIQLNVRFFLQELSLVPSSQNVKVEMGAQFSPKTHIRPEWHKGGSFPGAEDGGGEMSSIAKQLEILNKPKAKVSGDDEDVDGREELYAPDHYELERNRRAVEQLDGMGPGDPDEDEYRDAGGYYRRSRSG
jgi:hypothetical protein